VAPEQVELLEIPHRLEESSLNSL